MASEPVDLHEKPAGERLLHCGRLHEAVPHRVVEGKEEIAGGPREDVRGERLRRSTVVLRSTLYAPRDYQIIAGCIERRA